MPATKKDSAAVASALQEDQKKADLKAAYIKAKLKALDDNPALLESSIPEYTSGMDLNAAWKRLSFVTGGQGNANAGVKQRSSLDKIAPESMMPGRPVVSNAQQRERARAIGRKVSGEPLKGTVISGSNAAYDSPEYAAAAQPGGLREQERDAEFSTIQKAVFGSPQVGEAGSSDYRPASKDFKAPTDAVPNEDPSKSKLGTLQVGSAAVGTAPSADFQAAVAGKGYYDTPYGRISARKGRVGDISTPTDTHRLTLINQLKNKGITYDENAKYGSESNPFYRGRMTTDGEENDDFSVNKEADSMDADVRKSLGYDLPGANKTAGKKPETSYSYYGPMGEGPQNKVTNPTMTDYDFQNKRLAKNNPSLFKAGSDQNKRFVEAFKEAHPNYDSLKELEKIKARTKYMSNVGDNLLNDPLHYGETPLVLPSGTPNSTDPAKDPTIPD